MLILRTLFPPLFLENMKNLNLFFKRLPQSLIKQYNKLVKEGLVFAETTHVVCSMYDALDEVIHQIASFVVY